MRTYDPCEVLPRPTGPRALFSGLAGGHPGSVLVVDREGQPLRVLAREDDRLTAGEVHFGRLRAVYRVDVSEKQLELTATLPCADDVGGFDARVTLTCAVRDPLEVVRQRVRDAAEAVVPAVVQTLRTTCRRHGAEEHARAELAAARAVLEREQEEGHHPAFAIRRVAVVLEPDRAAASYLRERKEVQRDLQRQRDQDLLARERAEYEAERARQQQEFEAQRAAAAVQNEQFRLKLLAQQEAVTAEVERVRFEAALDRQELESLRAVTSAHARAEADLEFEGRRLEVQAAQELRKLELAATRDLRQLQLTAERLQLAAANDEQKAAAAIRVEQLYVEHYSELLRHGEFGALALRLVRQPDAVADVAAHLAHRRDQEVYRQLQALQALVENNALEPWQITDEAKKVLTQLVTTWSRETAPGQLDAGRGDGGEAAPAGEGVPHVVDVRDGATGGPPADAEEVVEAEPVRGTGA